MRCLLWLWLILPFAATPQGASQTAAQVCHVDIVGSSFLQRAASLSAARQPWTAALQLESVRQRTEASSQMEELGPAAPALSMLEVWLEQQPFQGLAGPSGEGDDIQFYLFYVLCFLFLSMLAMAVPFIGLGNDPNCCASFLGQSVRRAIEKFDRSILGVDVQIGRLSVNPFDGYIDCDHLIIHNPPGYTSTYMLRARKVLLDIDMRVLIQSCMNTISLEKLVFLDVDANYEKKWGTSNMQEVLQYIEEGPSEFPSETKPAPQDDSKPYDYEMHRVEVKNFAVKVRLGGSIGEVANMTVQAGDVFYKDFHTEVGDSLLEPIVRELLQSILKTVIADVVGNARGAVFGRPSVAIKK